MWWIDNLAERRIKEAQQRGEFDNLPGAGQPLVLDDDAAIPAELRVVYRLMKNAGYLPPDLQLRGEIASIEQLLAATNDSHERALYVRRLAYLMTRLNTSRPGGAESLQAQQAYIERLRSKIG